MIGEEEFAVSMEECSEVGGCVGLKGPLVLDGLFGLFVVDESECDEVESVAVARVVVSFPARVVSLNGCGCVEGCKVSFDQLRAGHGYNLFVDGVGVGDVVERGLWRLHCDFIVRVCGFVGC